jgi:integrase
MPKSDSNSSSKIRRIKKGIFYNSKTKFYFYRFEHYGTDFEKVIGPSREATEAALAEAKQEVLLKKFSGQGFESLEKLRRCKKPKMFSQCASDYLLERVDQKPSTVASYTSILKVHLNPIFGKKLLNDITDSDIRKFQANLNTPNSGGTKLSARRINTVMQLLRSILSQSYKVGELKRDPSLAVRRIQEDKANIDPLSEKELESVFAVIDSHYRPLFITLALTGARPNELMALRWGDVDWQSEILNINKGRVRGHEGDPKTKSAKRLIPLAPRVMHELELLESGSVKSITGYVFTKPNGEPIDKHLDRIWARALKLAGLRHRPSYQLRHTFATHCIIKGLPLTYIAKILGHSTIETLVRHYASWVRDSTKEQDDKLRDLFKKAVPEINNNALNPGRDSGSRPRRQKSQPPKSVTG